LANGGAPFNMSTELANGVAPLANGENGGRRGTLPLDFMKICLQYRPIDV
jgi:hypothetical protein